MKKSIKRYIEIVLTLAILVGLFWPYAGNQMPMDHIFPGSIDYPGFLALTIPIITIIPYLLILIFRDCIGNSLLRKLKVFFLLLYIITLGYYIYIFIDSLFAYLLFGNIWDPLISIVFSIYLILLSFKYNLPKVVELQNILLSIMTLPFIFYLSFILSGIIEYWEGDFNYGGYIINIAFLSLYAIALNNIYKNYKLKKFDKNEKAIAEA